MKWFLSYCILLLQPIVIGCVLYFHTLDANRAQAKRLNQSLMAVITNEFDHQMAAVLQHLDRLALDGTVAQLSGVKGRFRPADQYSLYTLYNNIGGTTYSGSYIKDVFVYFRNTDTIVSSNGNMSFALYYSLYGLNDGYPAAKMEGYLAQFHFRDVLPLTHGERRYLLFTMNSIPSNVGETSAVVGIWVDISNLEDLFEQARWDNQVQLAVLDGDNRLLYATAEQFQNVADYETWLSADRFEITVEGKRYLGNVVSAEPVNWNYILFIPTMLYEKNAREIQRVCLIGLCSCVVAGLFLSWFLCRMNYDPLKNLLERFKQQQRVESVRENEFQWLNRQSEAFFSEYNSNRRLLGGHIKQLRWHSFFMLLACPYQADKMEADLLRLKVPADAPYYTVLVFSIQHIAGTAQEYALCKFIIGNIVEEKLAQYYLAEVGELGNQVAALISLPEASASRERLKQMLEEVLQLLEDKFGFRFTAFMGGMNPGPEGIHEAYLQIQEMQEYEEFLDTGLIVYDELKNIQKKYMYPLETEQKIINAIKTGNEGLACEAVFAVLAQNCAAPISVDMRRCLVYDMVGTMLKGAEESGYYTFTEDFPIARQLAEEPFEVLKEQFRGYIRGLCAKICALRQENEMDQRISRNLERYIEGHYRDPDLNISILGQHFHLSPAHLSTVYKKQTGGGLLDYINGIRIGHAEGLLKAGHSIVETAALVGYRDSGTLIRIYKKKRGMTPGQMQKMARS